MGQRVQTIVDVEKPAGEYEAVWDATKYASGVYPYRLKAGDFDQTKKMLLLK